MNSATMRPTIVISLRLALTFVLTLGCLGSFAPAASALNPPTHDLIDNQWNVWQWWLDKPYQVGTPGARVGLNARDALQASGKVTVAFLDDGLNPADPSFAPNLWINQAEPVDGIDNDQNGYVDDRNGVSIFFPKKPLDRSIGGHGDLTARLAAGYAPDNNSMHGISQNVKIMPVQFMAGIYGDKDEYRAVRYAIKHGAKIINMSFGGPVTTPLEKKAVRYAYKRGVWIVASAGNGRENNDRLKYYPASHPYPNVISVASINRYGRLSRFSNYGKRTVDVAAPGEEIIASEHGQIVFRSGTSFAAPLVAGILASFVAKYGDLGYAATRAALKNSVTPLPGLGRKTAWGGTIDMTKLLSR